MAQNGGAPARSGGETHGDDDNSTRAPQRFIQAVPESLGTTRVLPEGRGGAEKVGAVPATKHRDGNDGDTVEKMTWTSSERPRHQNGSHTAQSSSPSEELERGALTGAGDEEGCSRLKVGDLQISRFLKRQTQIE